MPVHETSPGRFRWGRSGKTYSSKAAALRQARAVYASGWRDDGPPRRAQHRLLSASQRAEARYVLDLLAILRGIHRGVMAVVVREVLGDPAQYRQDAPPLPPGKLADRARRALTPDLTAKILRHVQQHTGIAFDRMAEQVQSSSAETAALLALPMASLAEGMDEVVDDARDANLALLEDAGREYADDVRDVLEDPDNEGLRVEELRDLLMERAKVSESRATLIARDQTLKLNAAINQTRQTGAGVERYTWSTSHDERVRPGHADLDGQVFSWDDPPETNDDGDTNHPGEDFACRCVALPYLEEPDSEDEDEPDEPAPDDDQEPDDDEG